MSMTEPFIDTELPCSQFLRRSRVQDGSGANGMRLVIHYNEPRDMGSKLDVGSAVSDTTNWVLSTKN